MEKENQKSQEIEKEEAFYIFSHCWIPEEKLDEAIEKFNSNLSKKFTLSISLGVDIYAISECVDIKTLLDSADKKMYHIKKKNHMNQ